MNPSIEIHQTLYGYEGGHALLASSIELSALGKRTMLVLSDMSGPRIVRGFETYLTCYPVPGTDFYTIARTWYAPEMPRPGCVWTHSLLIHIKDLDKITDMKSLEKLFQRPKESKDFRQYEESLRIIQPKSFVRDTQVMEFNGMSIPTFNMLLLLSDTSFDSLILPSDNPQVLESLMKTFWETTWGGLRRTITWCTGSIGGRSIDGKPFLVQVVPKQSISAIVREIGKAKVISTELTDKDLLSVLHLEFTRKYDGELVAQRFWKFASKCTFDLPEGREVISKLIDLFLEVDQHKHTPRLEKILNYVSLHFPEPTQARSLKRALFGPSLERILHVDEESLIQVLVTLKSGMCCGADELEIDRRAQQIYERYPKSVSLIINKAVSSEYNKHFYNFLHGISSVITVDEMIDLCHGNGTLLSYFISANPNLLLNTSIWKQSREIQEEAVDNVLKRKSELPSSYWGDLVNSMLDSNTGTQAERLIAEIGFPILDSFFDRVEQSKSIVSSIGNDWKMALRSNPNVLQSWLLKNPEPSMVVMAILAKSLTPTIRDLHTDFLKKWVDFAKVTVIGNTYKSDIEIMVFLLTLGFSNLGPGSEYLVSATFESVHDALDENKNPNKKLPYDSWKQLEPHVPSLGWIKDWDKCERLRRALVQKFSTNSWELQAFLESVESQNTFARLLKICKKSREGSLLLSRLIEKIQAGELSTTRYQKEELFKQND